MPPQIEGDVFEPKAKPLADLLKDIHEHKIALPDFQRDWIWEPEMVRQLLLSVARRYPVGSLLTMPVRGGSFQLRSFEGAGDLATTRPDLMILDGQQRLTSLYQSLYRLDGVVTKGRAHFFYLDVASILESPVGADDDMLLENALFYVVKDKRTGKRIRYDELTAVYDISDETGELANGAMPLGFLFDERRVQRWKKTFLRKRSNRDVDVEDALEERWDACVQPWLDCVQRYRFPVIELSENMPLSAICHIFEKVNSTGVPLDVFDLCTAILWTQGFRLNKEWEETAARLKPSLPMQPLSGTQFLQGICLLASLNRRQSNPAQPVTCRKPDLMGMPAATVKQWWPILTEGYKEAASFMAQEGILSERVQPYSTLIIPLSAIFAYVRHTRGAAHVGASWPKVSRWYWCCVFSQRYSSNTETIAAQDFEKVIGWLNGGDPPDVVRTFTFRSDCLEEISTLRNVIYKGILCLLAKTGAKDFGGGGSLSMQLFTDTRQDHHHVFPTEALNSLNISDRRADTIVNKTLINGSVNRSIGGRLPSEYIGTWRNRLGDAVFDTILTTHRVDPSVLVCDDWEAFRLDRRERLRSLILEVCGGNVQPFTNVSEPDTDGYENDE